MAITVYNTPASYAPAYNQMIFTLSSTNVTQPNFRYIADIYVNGSSDYTRLEVGKNPTNSSGVFDISGIIQNYLSMDADDNTTAFKTCGNSIVSYDVKFGEQYGASSGITNYTNLTTRTGYAYNGVFDPLTFLDYTKNKYSLFNSSSKFLTDCPNILTRVGEKLNIGYLVQNVGQTFLEIKVYTVTGTLQKTVKLQSPFDYSNVAEYSLNANISYDFLNSLVTGDLYEGTAPIFNASSSYYTIQMLYSDEPPTYSAVSEIKRITIDEYCSKYAPIRFKFMNNYGKYDYYTFTGAKTKSTNIKRNTYKSNPNEWSGVNYNYSRMSRGLSQYETVLDDTITINSDWITEAESEWLEQLVTSPDVYIYEGSNLVSVNITNANYETKYEASQQLFNLVISFTYSQNRKRQRR
jgi:hypothetical protein